MILISLAKIKIAVNAKHVYIYIYIYIFLDIYTASNVKLVEMLPVSDSSTTMIVQLEAR